eukprot:2885656-Prymnesium_polylepis.2
MWTRWLRIRARGVRQPRARDPTVDLADDRELAQLDYGAVDRVQCRHIHVQVIPAHFLVRQRAIGLLQQLCVTRVLEVDCLGAAELYHCVFEEVHLRWGQS